MNDGRVTVEISAGVANVVLARAEKMNALDRLMFVALTRAAERLAQDRSVRCVVLSGEGRAFCAGLDLGRFQKMANGEWDSTDLILSQRAANGANVAQQAAMIWRDLPVPVIAAVHGVAFGGGLQLALGADMRVVAPDARLAFLEINWGLVPDMGGLALARGLLRDDVACELMMTGRIVSGNEALSLGLATRVSENPVENARELAREIAGRSPGAIRAAKRLLKLARHADQHAILAAETDEQHDLVGKPDQIEAVKANGEKRAPVFTA